MSTVPAFLLQLFFYCNKFGVATKFLLQQNLQGQYQHITSSIHSSIFDCLVAPLSLIVIVPLSMVNEKKMQGQYPQITSSSHSSMVHC